MPPYPHLDPGPFAADGDDELGVLLVHGFTGAVTEVRALAAHLHAQGHTVRAPLLPGHGTHHTDLRGIGRSHWIEAVDAAFTDLASRVARVAVVGQSLGGLLALELATRRPVDAVVALAPALRVHPIAQLTRLPLPLRYLPKYEERRPDLVDVARIREVWSYTHTPLQSVREILALQREVTPRLAGITAPMLVVQGARDRTVDPRAARALASAPGTRRELLWLEASGHIVGVDQERDRVFADAARFLRGARA